MDQKTASLKIEIEVMDFPRYTVIFYKIFQRILSDISVLFIWNTNVILCIGVSIWLDSNNYCRK